MGLTFTCLDWGGSTRDLERFTGLVWKEVRSCLAFRKTCTRPYWTGVLILKRGYAPHITLGRAVRIVEGFDPSRYTELVQGTQIIVDKIVLKKSENTGSGVIHTILYSKAAKDSLRSKEERN